MKKKSVKSVLWVVLFLSFFFTKCINVKAEVAEDNHETFYVGRVECENASVIFDDEDRRYDENSSAIFSVIPDEGYVVLSVLAFDEKTGYPVTVDKQTDGKYVIKPSEGGAKIKVKTAKMQSHMVSENDIPGSVSASYPKSAITGKEVLIKCISDEGDVVTGITYSYIDENGDKNTFSCVNVGNGVFSFIMPESDVSLNINKKSCDKHSITLVKEGVITVIPSVSKDKAYLNEKVYLQGSFSNGIFTDFSVRTDKTYVDVIFDKEANLHYFLMPDRDVTVTAKEKIFKESNIGGIHTLLNNETLNEEIDVDIVDSKMSLVTLKNLSFNLLFLPSTRATYPDHTSSATADAGVSNLPTVTITKNAHWVDIEHGIAEISLTEKDTNGKEAGYEGMDVVIAIDRSDSTVVDWAQLWYNAEAGIDGYVSSSLPATGGNIPLNLYTQMSDHTTYGYAESPCLNHDHYYDLNGRKLYIVEREGYMIYAYTWDNGRIVKDDLSGWIDLRDYGEDKCIEVTNGSEHGACIIREAYDIDANHYDSAGHHIGARRNMATRVYIPLNYARTDAPLSWTYLDGASDRTYPVYELTGPTAWDNGQGGVDTVQTIGYQWSNAECRDDSRHSFEEEFAINVRDKLREIDAVYNVNTPSRILVWEYGDREDMYKGVPVRDNMYFSHIERPAADSRVLTVNGYDFEKEGLVYSTGGSNALLRNVLDVDITKTVYAGGGTDYGPSYHLAYEVLKSREGTPYSNRAFKFILLTDGEEQVNYASGLYDEDENGNYLRHDYDGAPYNATSWANKLKAYQLSPVSIYAIGIGMGGSNRDSFAGSGMSMTHEEYMKRQITGRNDLALSAAERQAAENGGAILSTYIPTTTAAINGSNVYSMEELTNQVAADLAGEGIYEQEIRAENKVFKDVVSDYFTISGVNTGNGSISYSGNTVTWNVTTGAGVSYNATVRIKLKDSFRYLEESKTSYPTNKDEGNIYGAKLTYDTVNISTNERTNTGKSIQTKTPVLPYGTVTLTQGDNGSNNDTGKVFTITGTETGSIFVTGKRRVLGQGSYEDVAKITAIRDENGNYRWKVTRKTSDESVPLVKYNNYEQELEYTQSEDRINGYYERVSSKISANSNGTLYRAIFENAPYDISLSLDKRDKDTGGIIKDAVFNVFAYKGSGNTDDIDNYLLYCYESFPGVTGDFKKKGKVTYVDYETYILNPSMYDPVELRYDESTGKYKNTDPIYYASESNKGYFMVLETKAPSGYCGDYKTVTQEESLGYKDKNTYPFTIDPTKATSQSAVIKNSSDGTFRNEAIKLNIKINKTGEVIKGASKDVSGNTIVEYEEGPLEGAWYVLRASDDIFDLQGNKLYEKGEIINLKPYQLSAQGHLVKLSDIDLSVYNDKESTHTVKVGESVSDNNIKTNEEEIRENKRGILPTLGTYVTKTEIKEEGYEYNSLLDDYTLDMENKRITFSNGQSTDQVFVTDGAGEIIINDLWQGDYEIIEVKAPAGYVRGRGYVYDINGDNKRIRPVNSAFVSSNETNENKPNVTKEVSFFNERQVLKPDPSKDPDIKITDNDPKISLIKKVNKGFFHPGETAKYEVIVTNTGDTDLKDGFIYDILDDSDDTLRIIGTFDYLKVGESKSYFYDYVVPKDDKEKTTHINTATVKAVSIPDIINGIPEKEVTDSDNKKIKVSSGLSIIKEADKKLYYPGESVTYKVVVTNNNKIYHTAKEGINEYKKEKESKTAHDLIVADTVLTEGIGQAKYVSSDMPERVKESADGSILIDYLEPGESCILKFDLYIPSDLSKGASVSGNGTDGINTSCIDNKVTVTDKEKETDEDYEKVYVTNPKIKIRKVTKRRDFDGNKIAQGYDNKALYEISVTNTGDINLTDTLLYDLLLTDGTFINDCVVLDKDGKIVENSGASVSGNEVRSDDPLFKVIINKNSVNLGDLPVGYTKKITFSYDIKEDECGMNIPNIMKVRAFSKPDKNIEQREVTDTDYEYIYSGVKTGIKKVSDNKDGIIRGTKGALFGLYAAVDILDVNGEVIVKSGELIESVYTDDNGYALFETEKLPLSEYVIKEISPPKGCYSSNMILYIHGREYMQNDKIHTVYVGGEIRNEGVKLLIYLYDDNTLNELADAVLSVKSESEEGINETFVTKNTAGSGYEVYGINPGETYVLTEKSARYGYVNEIVRDLSDKELNSKKKEGNVLYFSIPETDIKYYNDETDYLYGKIKEEPPKTYSVRITNDFTHGDLYVYKDGDFLDSWDVFDKLEHFFYSVISFIKAPMDDIEFSVYANDVIVHPDGVTGVLFNKGDIVATGVKSVRKDAVNLTDNAGMITFPEMYLGEYTLKETKGRDGYKVSDPINFSLAYIDDKTPVVYAANEGLSVYNPMKKTKVTLIKKDKTTDTPLAGAEFNLYADEDIKNRSNEVIIKKDECIEDGIITGDDGLGEALSILPIGHKFYLKEVLAPDGYQIDKENEYIPFETVPYNTTEEVYEYFFECKDTRVSDKIKVHKTAPEVTSPGQIIRFTIDSVKNESIVSADKFTLTDELPKNVYLTDLYTGSYNEEVSMIVLYKTNLSNEWKEWKKGISSFKGETLNVSDLKLKEKERITEFAIQYGTVMPGFDVSPIDNAFYNVKVGDVKENEELINNITLTAYVDNRKLTSSHQTKTKITVKKKDPDKKKEPKKTVKTGDDNYLYLLSLIELIISAIEAALLIMYMYKKKGKGNLKGGYILPVVLFSKCFLFLLLSVLGNNRYVKAKKEYRDVSECVFYMGSGNNEALPFDINWEELYKINPDIVAWVVIEGSDVNYPVVQTDNNEKYLKTTFEGSNNPSGCIFIDADNRADLSDYNTVIYGHNMRDGSMFKSINYYKDEEYYKDHPYVWILTPKSQVKYAVISAHVTDDGSETYDEVFADGDYKSHLLREISKSLYETNEEVDFDRGIITLSTCTKRNSNKRMVLICQGIKEYV